MQPLDASVRLVGRTDEIRAFEGLVASVAAGHRGALVSVTGDPGIGKSTLIRTFLGQADRAGLTTVERACWPGQGAPPLWVWDEVLRDLGAPPNLPEAAPQLHRFAAMADALAAAGSDRPLVVAIEDLHLADLDTVLFVRFLVRSIHRLPLILVVSWRTSGAGLTDDLAAVDAESNHRFHLGELSPDDVAELLTDYPALDDADRERCRAACGGNPFFIHELAQLVSAGDDQLPPSVSRIIEDRLASIDPEVREVILAAAVLGSQSYVGEVAMIAAKPNAEVADVGPVSADLLRVDDLRVLFQHQIVREVLLTITPSAELIRLHRRAVDMLTPAQSTAEACRRAEHAAAAGVESVEAAIVAVQACCDAAERARRDGGLHRAADLLALAVAARDVHPQLNREPELLVQHAEAVLATGRLADARLLFATAVDAADEAGDIISLARGAVGLGGVWVEEARDAATRDHLLTLLRRGIAELPESENVLRARLAIRLAAELRYQGDATVDDVAAALERLRPLDDDRALAESLSVYHHVLLTPPYADHRVDIAEELIEVATRAGDELHAVVGRCWLTVDLYLLGDPRADRALEDFRAHAGALGCHSLDYIVAVLDAMCAMRDGRLDDAEALAAAAFELGTEVGDADAFGYFGGHLMALRWMQGRVPEIRPMIDDLATSATLRTHDMVFAAAAAAAAAVDGDHEAADRWIRGTGIGSTATVPLFSTWSTSMMALAEAALVLDDAVLADDVLPLIEPYADHPVRASLAITCVGPMRRLIGRLHIAAGRIDLGIDTLRTAITDCRQLRNRPVDAILHAELASALLKRGTAADRDEARPLLRHALAEAEAMALDGRVAGWTALMESITHRDHEERATEAAGPPAGVVEWHDSQWCLSVSDRTVWMRDSVGMRHLVALLAAPGRDFSAIELSVAAGGSAEDWAGEPLIDDAARSAYARRLTELERDIQKAEDDADLGWVERLRAEHEELIRHLSAATDLRGRTRTSGGSRERARTRVSKALRRVIQQIAVADQLLGRELERTIQTGHACSYDPDPVNPRQWDIRR